jgi:hypothetical protein
MNFAQTPIVSGVVDNCLLGGLPLETRILAVRVVGTGAAQARIQITRILAWLYKIRAT